MSERNKWTQKILIVDDSEMNREILSEMLGEEYEILEAENGEQAVTILQKSSTEISLILLDIVMPVMDGYEVLSIMNSNGWNKDIPVIMISSESSPASIDRAYELGIADFVSRPFDATIVRHRVVNTILLYAKQKKLERLVADQIYEKERNSSLMIAILSHIVEFRNGESGLHVLHVQNYTEVMLRRLVQITDKYRISGEEITMISNASALHDIGKISISDEILNKPGRLTKEEFEIMKTHSSIGASMLKELSVYQNEPLVKIAYEICRWHHERYDGSGYPDGLRGDEIPISAQIVAMADVYDALTSERVYKKAFSHEKAVEMILNGECGAFNPLLLQCFQDVAETIRLKSKSSSVVQNNEREMKSVSEELLRHEELSASERTLKLLRHERLKNQFFCTISKEIDFEYTNASSMVTVSPYGARKLGIKECIVDPLHDEELCSIIKSEDMQEISKLLRSTTPSQPIVECRCMIKMDGEMQNSRMFCRTVWSDEEPPQYMGALGELICADKEAMAPEIMEQISSQDILTGLMNESYSSRLIRKLLDGSGHKKYAMAILDMDNLDSVNKKYGFAFGDNLLMHIAGRVRRSIKKRDIAARIGGDEILIFVEYEKEMEEEIRRVFSSLQNEQDLFPISVCMGAADAGIYGSTYEELYQHSSRALRMAKKGGRGTLCFYDDSMEKEYAAISPMEGNGQ